MSIRFQIASALVKASGMPIGSFLCSALALALSVTQIFALFGLCTIVFYVLLGRF